MLGPCEGRVWAFVWCCVENVGKGHSCFSRLFGASPLERHRKYSFSCPRFGDMQPQINLAAPEPERNRTNRPPRDILWPSEGVYQTQFSNTFRAHPITIQTHSNCQNHHPLVQSTMHQGGNPKSYAVDLRRRCASCTKRNRKKVTF